MLQLQTHGDAITGGILAGFGSLAATTLGVIPGMDHLNPVLGVLVSLLVGCAPVVLKRILSGRGASDRVRAAQLRAKAAKLAEGSKERVALEDQADGLEADAAAAEAAAK